MSTLFVFFPVYNEGSAAATLVRRLDAECRRLSRPYRFLAVDDGSTDGSGKRLTGLPPELPLTLVSHPENRGLAAALGTGLEWLSWQGEPGDVVVMMDGDDTHDPACLAPMLAALEGGADLVVASRFRRGAVIRGVPAHRRLLSRGASLLGRIRLAVPGVRDYTCGYRAARWETVKAVAPRFAERAGLMGEGGFSCSLELLLMLAEASRTVTEVPIVLRYDRKECPSHMSAGRTILGTLQLLARQMRDARVRSQSRSRRS